MPFNKINAMEIYLASNLVLILLDFIKHYSKFYNNNVSDRLNDQCLLTIVNRDMCLIKNNSFNNFCYRFALDITKMVKPVIMCFFVTCNYNILNQLKV